MTERFCKIVDRVRGEALISSVILCMPSDASERISLAKDGKNPFSSHFTFIYTRISPAMSSDHRVIDREASSQFQHTEQGDDVPTYPQQQAVTQRSFGRSLDMPSQHGTSERMPMYDVSLHVRVPIQQSQEGLARGFSLSRQYQESDSFNLDGHESWSGPYDALDIESRISGPTQQQTYSNVLPPHFSSPIITGNNWDTASGGYGQVYTANSAPVPVQSLNFPIGDVPSGNYYSDTFDPNTSDLLGTGPTNQKFDAIGHNPLAAAPVSKPVPAIKLEYDLGTNSTYNPVYDQVRYSLIHHL